MNTRELRITIAIVTTALVVVCVLLAKSYLQVGQLESVIAHKPTLHSSAPLGPQDTQIIAGWMTFDYINHLFALPPDYLKTSLAITDSRYPRLTITEYAEHAHAGQGAFLGQVQNSVRAYASQTQ